MFVEIDSSLVRDTHSLAKEADALSQSLLQCAFQHQDIPGESVTIEITKEGLIKLSTLLMMLSNNMKAVKSS